MTASASWELQTAIVTALKADATLQGLQSQRVFDHVPRRTTYPYTVYDGGDTSQWDTSETGAASGDGEEHLISIHVFDDYEGMKRIKDILQRVKELLQDNTSFVLADHFLINLRFQLMDIMKDSDGQTYHGIAQFRAVTEEM